MKTLFTICLILLFAGCVSTPQVPAPEECSGDCVKYYSTYKGKTQQDFPEEDWPYVKEMRELPPVTSQIEFLWINYDQNALAVAVVDTTTGNQGCIEFLFTDVTVATGEKWREATMINSQEISCDDLVVNLVKELDKQRI